MPLSWYPKYISRAIVKKTTCIRPATAAPSQPANCTCEEVYKMVTSTGLQQKGNNNALPKLRKNKTRPPETLQPYSCRHQRLTAPALEKYLLHTEACLMKVRNTRGPSFVAARVREIPRNLAFSCCPTLARARVRRTALPVFSSSCPADRACTQKTTGDPACRTPCGFVDTNEHNI